MDLQTQALPPGKTFFVHQNVGYLVNVRVLHGADEKRVLLPDGDTLLKPKVHSILPFGCGVNARRAIIESLELVEFRQLVTPEMRETVFLQLIAEIEDAFLAELAG